MFNGEMPHAHLSECPLVPAGCHTGPTVHFGVSNPKPAAADTRRFSFHRFSSDGHAVSMRFARHRSEGGKASRLSVPGGDRTTAVVEPESVCQLRLHARSASAIHERYQYRAYDPHEDI